MAYLTQCSVCGHGVSSEARACPGCGHDVASELRKIKDRENEIKVNEIKRVIVGNWFDDRRSESELYNNSYIIEPNGRWYKINHYVGINEFEGSRYYVFDDGTIQLNMQYNYLSFVLQGNKLVGTKEDKGMTLSKQG